MELSKTVKEDIVRALEGALERGDSFPIEVVTGKFTHLISKENGQRGYLVGVIEYANQDFLIYLTG